MLRDVLTHPVLKNYPSERAVVSLLMLLATIVALSFLRSSSDLVFTSGGLRLVLRFFTYAFTPAIVYESVVPAGTIPLLLKALFAVHTTIVFAAAAMSLALLWGGAVAFFASSVRWAALTPTASPGHGRVRATLLVGVYTCARATIAIARSVHELLWGVLLLAAFGTSELAAVVAIAIPFAGILAKVFSEIIEEAPRDAAVALHEAGVSSFRVFVFALLPRAFPDMAAYAIYRFECAIRSSAIFGFFGFPTIGYFVATSFENMYFGEVWTYLYALFCISALLDCWSAAVRRRLLR